MTQHAHHRHQLWGWILFISSAVFFMAASIRADGPVSLIGGILFFVACFFFLVPLLIEIKAKTSNSLPPSKCSRYRHDWFLAGNSQWLEPGARWIRPAPEHHRVQIQRHLARSELRFFASTR